MNRVSLYQNLKLIALAVLFSFLAFSCHPKEPPVVDGSEEVVVGSNPVEPVEPVEPAEPVGQDEPDPDIEPIVWSTGPSQEEYENLTQEDVHDYTVDLEVTDKIRLDKKGEMFVWIGVKGEMPEQSQGMVRDVKIVPNVSANYVRITPYAPEFEVDPPQKVMPLEPDGCSTTFTLIPIKEGSFMVRAEVEFFKDEECTLRAKGPQNSARMEVKVSVSRIKELLDTVWHKFKDFWGILVTLIFAALLFVIRKYIKKKTGYGGNGELESGTEAEDSQEE